MIELPYYIVNRSLAAKRFHIFLFVTIRVYVFINVMSEI